MREIKFRAWCTIEDKLYDDFYVEAHMKYAFMNELIDAARKRYKFMQYTGLKDKNGVEIYEGDILGQLSHWGFYVGFEKGCFIEIPTDKVQRYNRDFRPLYIRDLRHWEVIGNVHKNPELLEASE